MDILKDPVAVLQKYLQIDTTDSQNDHEACQFWSSVFSKYHVKNQVVSSDSFQNFETVSNPNQKERILLQNHLDVVPANREGWDYDPFSGHIDGKYLYGRGALDMKSIGVLQAYAFLRLVKENHSQKELIKFCSLVQEETSSENGAKFYVKYLEDEGYQNLIVLGEGGFCMKIPEIFEGDLFLYEAEQKGLLWLSMTVHSKGGHGSIASKSGKNNPVIQAAKVAQKLTSYPFPLRVENSVANFINILFEQSHNKIIRLIGDLPGLRKFLFRTRIGTYLLFNIITRVTGIPDLFRTSLNVTNISTDKMSGVFDKDKKRGSFIRRLIGSQRKKKYNPVSRLGVNVIPNYATLTCDIRFNSVYDCENLTELIKRIVPKHVDFQQINCQQFSTSDYHIIQQTLQAELKKQYGRNIIVSPFLFIASSDNYFFRKHGHRSFGLAPIRVTVSDLERIHGDNERINIDSFKKGCEDYYRILKALVESLK